MVSIEKSYQPKAKKPSYKDKLTQERATYSEHLGSLDSQLQQKLGTYYQALKGECLVTSKATGRQIKARSYEQRLELAEQQLKGLESSIILKQRYDKITNQQAKAMMDHARSLYNIAIRDNEYLTKKGNLEAKQAATRINQAVSSLEEKVEVVASGVMQADTGYTNAFTKPLDTIVSFPSQEKKKSRFWGNMRLGFAITTAAAGMLLTAACKKYTTSETVSYAPEIIAPAEMKVMEKVNEMVSNLEPPKPELKFLPPLSLKENAQDQVERNRSSYSFKAGVSFPTSEEAIGEQMRIERLNEIARQFAISRVKAAKEELKLKQLENKRQQVEYQGLSRILSPQTIERVKQQQEEEKEVQRAPLPSARAMAMKIWHERSQRRALAVNLPVVKQVIYYPDGSIVKKIPGKENRVEYASNAED